MSAGAVALEAGEPFAFTPENDAEAQRIIARYPPGRQASAVLPLLQMAQAQYGGWLPRTALDYVADYLRMPRIRVYEVATFYDMYNTRPVGRVQVRVCTTTPCWLCGSDEVLRACRDVLGVGVDETTADGGFFLREFECLGACANAPILWVDDDFYEDLDYERTRAILEALKRGERPPAGSSTGRQASMPAGGKTTLFDDPHARPEKPREGEGEGEKGRPDEEPVDKARPEEEVREQAARVEAHGRPADAVGEEAAAPEDAGEGDASAGRKDGEGA